MVRLIRVVPLLLVTALVIAAGVAITGPDRTSAARGQIVPGSYIVTLRPGASANTRTAMKAQAYGFQVRHVYRSALNGFSAVLSERALERLEQDPDVLSIVPDRKVFAFEDQRPTGIRRTLADRNPISLIGSDTNPITVDVAVIDTGVDIDHPDLNVVGGVSCVPGQPSYDDQNGHGTHVAGTIGALDNGIGVVGVAPGTRIWAVRVLDASGEGTFSDVICGIDWVTANAGVIDVANMSLGGEGAPGSCNDGDLRAAVCRSVAAGVTYVVAAGNSGADASGFVPASYPEVITVSAIVDTDGAPGGRGGTSFFYGNDDQLALFSNFGAPVDIAAPGFNIYSTWRGGGYNYSSGTSMASPHVAGAAAIYLYLNPAASPAGVQSFLQSIAWPQGSEDGFTGDPDGNSEPLLNAGSIGGDPLPPPMPACTADLSEGIVGAKVAISCGNFGSRESVRVYWDSSSTNQRASFFSTEDGSGDANLTIPASPGGEHQVVVKGMSSGLEVSLPFTVLGHLRLNSESGKVGSTTSVYLTGMPAGASVPLTWDDLTTPLATPIISQTGAATVYLPIPESTAGPHSLSATTPSPDGGDPIELTANYTVLPSVNLSPSIGRVGATTTINLRGYAAGENVTVFWYDTPTTSTALGTVTVSEFGSGTTALIVPEATKGTHTIEAAGDAGNVATASFSVSLSLSLSASSGTVGTPLTATANGFTAHEPITVLWYDTTTSSSVLTTATASATGGVSIPVEVPEAVKGMHKVEAVGTTSGKASAYLTVNTTISLSPTAGLPESTVSVTLTGFKAGETVDVKWFSTATASTVVGSAGTSSVGSATATFVVPVDATTGDHKVEALGGSSFARVSTTFTVESNGPPPSTDPSCTVSATTGVVGDSIQVACQNFSTNEYIRIYWDTTAGTYRASIWTGTSGGGSANLSVPDMVAGGHTVIARGATSGGQIDLPFTLVASLKLSATSGAAGGFVSATLKGFAAGESVAITWDGGAALATVTTNGNGSGSKALTIPDAVRGDHQVQASGAASGEQPAVTYKVVPSVTLSPSQAAVGASIAVTFRGYAADETILLRWYDSATSPTDFGTAVASAVGTASATFTVPATVGGGHQVEGAGTAGSLATTTFTVVESLSLSATSGAVGSPLLITINGFAAEEPLTVQWFDTTTSSSTISTPTTNEAGSAAVSLQVPEATHGSHKVLVTGTTSGESTYKFFTIKVSVSLDVTSGPPGTAIAVNAAGYRGGETINVSWFSTTFASSVVTSGTASPLGSATLTFSIPADASLGDHKVEGKGLSSLQRANATVTVTEASSGEAGGLATDPDESTAPPPPPAIDVPFSDDFQQATEDGGPLGWSLAPGSSSSTVVGVESGHLTFLSPPNSGGATWLVRDGVVFTRPDVQVKLHFGGDGAGAGLILAWSGPNDYVAVLANADLDRLEVIKVSGGVVRTGYATEPGSVEIEPLRDYWLRAETGADAAGRTWVSLYWLTDGQTMQPVAAVEGLANLWGSVGLLTVAGNSPQVRFDDVIGRRSEATQPVAVASADEDGQPTEEATATPVPTDEPTPDTGTEVTPPSDETPTPEPAPTETSTPEPEPTETPEPEPTAVETPTPDPPAADPPAADPPAADPPADEEGDGQAEGDESESEAA